MSILKTFFSVKYLCCGGLEGRSADSEFEGEVTEDCVYRGGVRDCCCFYYIKSVTF